MYYSYEYTVCPRSSDPSYIVSYFIKRVTTSLQFILKEFDDIYMIKYVVSYIRPFVSHLLKIMRKNSYNQKGNYFVLM